MNPNFDFRDSWDDTPIDSSVGDDLAVFRNKVIGWSAAIISALLIVMGVWA